MILNSKEYKLYKENPYHVTSWVNHIGYIGEFIVTFDGKTGYNLFSEYPRAFSKEQLEIFDKEHPFWANFFKDRKTK